MQVTWREEMEMCQINNNTPRMMIGKLKIGLVAVGNTNVIVEAFPSLRACIY